MWSEAVKVLKGEYTVRAIKEHKMDQAIIFCRTKIDCDNLEQYFMQQGGGNVSHGVHVGSFPPLWCSQQHAHDAARSDTLSASVFTEFFA